MMMMVVMIMRMIVIMTMNDYDYDYDKDNLGPKERHSRPSVCTGALTVNETVCDRLTGQTRLHPGKINSLSDCEAKENYDRKAICHDQRG